MTGYENLNFPLFHAEAARLRGLGYKVVNPAEINANEPAGFDPVAIWQACMRADIKQLMDCTAIALLPGWEDSKGATLECHIAQSLGFFTFMASDVVAERLAA